MPFDIGPSLDGKIEVIDEYSYETLSYTGQDDGTESFFHAVGYMLRAFGLFQGDAPTLRRLTAKNIFTLARTPARALICEEIKRQSSLELQPYIDALAAAKLPGDLVSIWAIENLFAVRIELRPIAQEVPLPPQSVHFCPSHCDTMYIALQGKQLFLPMNLPELPALIADNYCLTCGVGVPNPLESICDDCVRRPRFCISCGLVYVERGSMCEHCAVALSKSLHEDASRPHTIPGTVMPCGLPVESEEPTPELKPESRPKFIIYLSNAPFDDFRSGDGSYINALVNWLNTRGTLTHGGLTYEVCAIRLCDEGLAEKIPPEEQSVKRLAIRYIVNWPTLKSQTEKMTMKDWQELYEPARQLLLEALISERQKDEHPESVHIFHVQVRYPDSGALFNKAFLDKLAEHRFQIVVTCHEMKFNLLNAENMQRNVVQMNDFVASSKRTIFLNEHDLMCAVKLATAGSLSTYNLARSTTPLSEKQDTDAGTSTERMRRKLKVDVPSPSAVNPLGICVDTITVPPERLAALFHIPGIATVKGVAFKAEDILERPPNVLVFGLIKQVDAMEQTAAVARAIQDSPALGAARVWVVGKVFKDFKHNAIATLVGRMYGLSVNQIATLCKNLDDAGDKSQSDQEFYTTMQKEIDTRKDQCKKTWDTFIEKTCEDFGKPLDTLYEALSDVVTCDIPEQKEDLLLGQIQKAQFNLRQILKNRVYWTEKRSKGEVDTLCDSLGAQLSSMKSIIDPLDKPCYEQRERLNSIAHGIQTALNTLRTQMTALQKKVTGLHSGKAKWPFAPLPIKIVFDAPPDEFQRIAAQCKYAFKVDQKSMADNASSIISLMSNGCITFTESRFDTPNEFFKDNDGALSPVIMPPQKYGTCNGTFVVKEILRREQEAGAQSNRQTLKNMQTLLVKRYGLDAVAAKHLLLYKTFLA